MRYFPHGGGAVYELGQVPDGDVPAEVSEDMALFVDVDVAYIWQDNRGGKGR